MADLFATPAAAYARVALPVPVDRLFDYAIPPELDAHAQVGFRVRVSFDGRPATGVIVERTAASSAPRVRPLERVLDAEAALSPALLRILVEEAREVLCPVGLAVATALPPGSSPEVRMGFALTPRGREALRAGAARGDAAKLLARLEGGPRDRAALSRAGFGAEATQALAADGLIAPARVESRARPRVRTERTARIAAGVDLETVAAGLKRAPRQRELLAALADGPQPLASLGDGAGEALRRMAARGLVEIEEREVLGELDNVLAAPDRAVQLTEEQERACETIGTAVDEHRYERFLLHGVTGSGKTEVYLRAAARALQLGRQALVLVPEITLTHQIVARVRARFGDAVAVLHSGLRPRERVEQWERLRRGEKQIAVGARSALFAPLASPGLIVIDEEHDSAYKNEEGFRYHARNLAARRAREAGCPLVLGSATPSLETRHASKGAGVRRLVLAHRIGGRPLPGVQLVDLAKERAQLPRGRKPILSRPLRRALADTLAEGGQTLLFLNRRGFSTQITCFSCGHVERCGNCDIALVYHTHGEALRCHYCDASKPPESCCPACGSDEYALLGVGTQRLEEEVRSEFPGARVARLDRDVAMRRGATEETLRALRDAAVDVVVGTQMLAKGHDFPGVRLVGVVHADLSLHFPDFRAAERTFQLLTQVAGRAGRGDEPGRVIVQTYAPDHYAIRPVMDHDYERFFKEEMEQRTALDYPPLGTLAHTLVSGPELDPVREAADALAGVARTAAGDRAEVLGPAPAPIARLRGRHRYQLLVKGLEADAVQETARALAEAAARLARPLRAHVDVNPVSML